MKKLILIIFTIFLTSCVKDVNPIIDKDVNDYPISELVVTVTPNKASIVKLGTDTLAVLTRTRSIAVPKYSEITITEIDNSNNNLKEKYKLWETVAFEDSKVGDYDYNDLVIHVLIEQKNNNTQVSIHPIALGSTKIITLGLRVDGIDHYLTKDCRKDLFNNREGFINTYIFQDRVKYEKFAIKNFPLTKSTWGKSLDWFIEVDNGLRLYAVSKNYPTSNRPYGLILIDINNPYKYGYYDCGLDWFDYPSEGIAIEEVYPDFSNKDRTFKEIYSNKQGGYYPAIVAEGKYATKECLYAID